MALSLLKFAITKPKLVPSRDWSNQELAELFRVRDILGQAGIPLNTDRGLSDEGEPWFVYVRSDTGDVLTHLARIDGEFIAVSALTDTVYRGQTFRGVIDAMLDQHPIMLPRNGRTRFFSHPVAILTALVASAILLDKKDAMASKLSDLKILSDQTHEKQAQTASESEESAVKEELHQDIQDSDRKFTANLLKAAQEGNISVQSFSLLAVVAAAFELDLSNAYAASNDASQNEEGHILTDIASAILAAISDDEEAQRAEITETAERNDTQAESGASLDDHLDANTQSSNINDDQHDVAITHVQTASPTAPVIAAVELDLESGVDQLALSHSGIDHHEVPDDARVMSAHDTEIIEEASVVDQTLLNVDNSHAVALVSQDANQVDTVEVNETHRGQNTSIEQISEETTEFTFELKQDLGFEDRLKDIFGLGDDKALVAFDFSPLDNALETDTDLILSSAIEPFAPSSRGIDSITAPLSSLDSSWQEPEVIAAPQKEEETYKAILVDHTGRQELTASDSVDVILYEKGNVTIHGFEWGKDRLWFMGDSAEEISSTNYSENFFQFIMNDGEYTLTFHTKTASLDDIA